jgi:uncharacterized protein (TIGR02444 family)
LSVEKAEKTSANPFWDFSLKVYARPGAAEAALKLQDEGGQDVNLLLFCCWAAVCGHPLSQAEARALEAESEEWRRSVVQPLRQVRRHLKPLEPEPGVAALRAQVKRQELAAEWLQQDRLNRLLPLTAAGEEAGAQELAGENLSVFFEATGQGAHETQAFLKAVFGSGV